MPVLSFSHVFIYVRTYIWHTYKWGDVDVAVCTHLSMYTWYLCVYLCTFMVQNVCAFVFYFSEEQITTNSTQLQSYKVSESRVQPSHLCSVQGLSRIQ